MQILNFVPSQVDVVWAPRAGPWEQALDGNRSAGQGPGKATASPKRVLVIEDNIDSARSLAYLLAEMGHHVEYAINGYVGVDIAKRFRPDFVLLDLGLPGLNGFEVCASLKKEPDLKHTRIIAITGYTQEDYRARSKAAGCEMHLIKPVPASVLEEILG